MQANDSRDSIKRADIVGKDLVVHWGDGHRGSFHPIWLRHQCECETCGRLNERQVAPLDAPAHQIDTCYRALRLTFKLQAGEGLIFDDQRVFHGRTVFSPEEPTRSVLTSPVDLEEFYSNIRLLRTSLEEGASPITYGQEM